MRNKEEAVSILILLDYLFLSVSLENIPILSKKFQSLFYWITYSYMEELLLFCVRFLRVSILILLDYLFLYYFGLCFRRKSTCFNPYFTGLPILMLTNLTPYEAKNKFQSLFYWITYSYCQMV